MAVYIPRQGDIIAITFDPQSGHEQKGRRPALIGDIRSERAWLVLQLFNIDNRFSHLINIISHVGLFPR